MADSGTDTFVGVTLALVIAVAVVAAANGDPLTIPSRNPGPAGTTRAGASTRPAPTPAPRSTTNIPGGTLPACSGDVISNETVDRSGATINLKIYYQTGEGGRNCAVATKIGDTARSPGPMVITLRFTDSASTDWPEFAEHRSSAASTRSGFVYLDRSDDRCVRAEARFTPNDGEPVSVSSGRTGCD